MTHARVLLVEDEPGLALTLTDRLTADGYEVAVATSGEEGIAAVLERTFELILLDVMLPGIDGFETCRRLRRRGLATPILMLTARGEVADRVHGLRLGADDYLIKPFDPDELVARMEALLRRAPEPMPGTQRFGDVEVDLRGMSVRRSGAEVELAAMEFQLLAYFLAHRGRALTRERILRDVWGYQRVPRTRTVDVHVTWLRQKLEPNRARPIYIHTVRGVGYKFVSEPDSESSTDLATG